MIDTMMTVPVLAEIEMMSAGTTILIFVEGGEDRVCRTNGLHMKAEVVAEEEDFPEEEDEAVGDLVEEVDRISVGEADQWKDVVLFRPLKDPAGIEILLFVTEIRYGIESFPRGI